MLKFGMQYFNQQAKQWWAESVPLQKIAQEVGTPCYVYSRAALEQGWQAFDAAFKDRPHQVNFAVKANSNLAVLNILAKQGSGFDIVSLGELKRVLKAEGKTNTLIFSGVGKTAEELIQAIQIGIGCINVESKAELMRLTEIATTLGKKVPIAFRVNPDVDPKSHPYISTGLQQNKFGVSIPEALELYKLSVQCPNINVQGIAFHIGSQITELSPFLEALDKILLLIDDLKASGILISHLNLGGGLGVRYRQETPPEPKDYVSALLARIKDPTLTLHIEPGRAIAANAGILLTRIEYLKKQTNQEKYFAIVDAAMNDLLRPALYEAWQDITAIPITPQSAESRLYDIVGPVCETADFLGKDRILSVHAGDLLAISSAGAYGFSMSSNYNSRPRAAEVMIDGDHFEIIRPRERLEDLFQHETLFSLK